MREFTTSEQLLISQLLGIRNVEVGFFEVTETQLKKSIIDANKTICRTFAITGFHDFNGQLQGQPNLKKREIFLLTLEGLKSTELSMYRPRTKEGDPRIWIYRFSQLLPSVQNGDVVAVIQDGNVGAVVNITDSVRNRVSLTDVEKLFLTNNFSSVSGAAEELLEMLEGLALKGSLITNKRGAMAVGHAIESALGIKPNSSKAPDYKGIEIKSGRSLQSNSNKTLFAQVPDWVSSPVGSYTELIKRYGYLSEEGSQRLYCSVDGLKPNTQGLQLNVNYFDGLLEERCVDKQRELALVWDLEVLRSRFAEKHAETFWIEAQEVRTGAGKGFVLTEILHTSTPRLSALTHFLSDGTVFVDHAGKLKPSGSGNRNHGMLFRTKAQHLAKMFTVDGVHYL